MTDDNDTRSGVVVISLNRLELITCVNDGVTNPVTALWTRTSGAVGIPARVNDLVGDPAGRSYITGYTTGGLDGNPMIGGRDAFLHARDRNGDRIWSVQLGAPGSFAQGYGIATNRTWEEIYVSGGAQGDVGNLTNTTVMKAHNYVAKFDTAGNRLWVVQQDPAVSPAGGQAAVYSNGVNREPNGNLYLGGYTGGNFGGNTLVGTSDTFVTKLAAP
ncbi:hypothetical protein D7V97_12495 [Corallococcus sp. CA053C]|nr:hypothetical protein D7V97_12495 [Corallococcus sp. CA053C]